MKRFAFKMKLKPGLEKEYEKRHAAIWPELVEMIHQQGVSNYSIYWDKDTNILFAYQECSVCLRHVPADELRDHGCMLSICVGMLSNR